MSYDFEQLLVEYRKLWNNRLLAQEDLDSEVIVIEAIKRELKDENSHPRIRKSIFEKYYLATKRILESNISNEYKMILIELHKEIMKDL
ncbi:hypothetical protein [Neobacillus sp. D3-1R]|uniref:hypothetical protein n=1 Tax=Neobacillus sp. D3-1R TaxID=3445778 RepID=UPI003F9FFDCF